MNFAAFFHTKRPTFIYKKAVFRDFFGRSREKRRLYAEKQPQNHNKEVKNEKIRP